MKWIILLLIFYENYNENFEFCTRMYTRSTMDGIEFVFNNQTVPIFVLCVKTLCGIDLLSFNNLLCCILNPIDNLIDRRRNMSDMTCRNHFAVFNWLTGGLRTSHTIFRVRVVNLGFAFRVLIQPDVAWRGKAFDYVPTWLKFLWDWRDHPVSGSPVNPIRLIFKRKYTWFSTLQSYFVCIFWCRYRVNVIFGSLVTSWLKTSIKYVNWYVV